MVFVIGEPTALVDVRATWDGLVIGVTTVMSVGREKTVTFVKRASQVKSAIPVHVATTAAQSVTFVGQAGDLGKIHRHSSRISLAVMT